MSVWFSIEVIAADLPASAWAEAWSDALIGSALNTGASDWAWHRHAWGVVFEAEFADETAWEAFRLLPSVQAALDGVPDPLTGLIVYRGRGGGSSSPEPRKPKPMSGSGSAALPLPWDDLLDWHSDLSSLLGPASWRQPAGTFI